MTEPLDGFPGRSYPLGANPSFSDLVRANVPTFPRSDSASTTVEFPHGTTVLALKFDRGVVMAGDRRAIEGFTIADERIDKVFPADETSAVAIAGAAGQATEIVRLFQTELEHYEKVEGDGLSLEGKANKLGQMIRLNLPMAIQGLVVVPIFAGFDLRREEGRIFKYDVTGGRYEEIDYYATGSGGKDARSTLKKLYRPGVSREEAIRMAAEALLDAAEEDVGTGGPDFVHGIFPTLKVITRAGYEEVPEPEVRAAFEAVVAARREAEGAR